MDERAERLARGDRAAFGELYDACADRVFHYLAVRLRSRADAEDVLQQTFVRLARTRSRLATVENVIAYVFATARNEANRLLRRHSRGGRLLAALPAEMSFQEVPGDDISRQETAEWVAASLARLRDEQREVVELKIYAGLTFREIGQVIGIPQGTAATRYRAALEALRGQMAKEQE